MIDLDEFERLLRDTYSSDDAMGHWMYENGAGLLAELRNVREILRDMKALSCCTDRKCMGEAERCPWKRAREYLGEK